MDCGQCLKRPREPVLANNGQTNWRVVQIYTMAGLVIVHFSRPVCSPLKVSLGKTDLFGKMQFYKK